MDNTKNTVTEKFTTAHRSGEKVLTKKAYGLKYGLKGADLKRKHYAYLMGNPLSDLVKNIKWSRVSVNPKTGHVSGSGYTEAAMKKKAPSEGRRSSSKVIDIEAAKAALEAAGYKIEGNPEEALAAAANA